MRNFLINGYYSIHSLDHDDGSYRMRDEGNVVAFAGMKNFEGFNKLTVNNLFVRPDFAPGFQPTKTTPDGVPLPMAYYFPACARSEGQWTWGPELADVFSGNVCVLNATSDPYIFGSCNPNDVQDGQIPLSSNNTIYSLGASYAVKCGSSTLSLAEAQAKGLDTGSVVKDAADMTTDQLVQLIYQYLGM